MSGLRHSWALSPAEAVQLQLQLREKILITPFEGAIRCIGGAYTPIKDGEETLGFALCTKDRVKPVFVSPGHRITLGQSREVMLHCARGV